jgi:hypothetical protein
MSMDYRNEYYCMNFSEVTGKCNGKQLSDIGPVGQTMTIQDEHGNIAGGTLHLFQCEDCKSIKLLLPL